MIKDIAGEKFGRLTVIEDSGKRADRYVMWKCICDCGNIRICSGRDLRRGHTRSCSCIQKESVSTHGLSAGRFYNIYKGIKKRCFYPSHISYKHYGGRGIKCLWSSFEKFRDDMYESYQMHIEKFGEKQTEIDRIDNDGNYCRGNCRWATRIEQARNKRRL